jgi:peptidoglycan lytic transglycosylase
VEQEISGRKKRRDSSRVRSVRGNAFVPDYAEGADRPRAGLGFRSAAGVWIFVAMMLAFAAVSCGQHHTSARVPTVSTTAGSAGGGQSADGSANGGRADASSPAGTTDGATGAHLGPVPNGEGTEGVRKHGPVEQGIASWYGVPYHGRRASNGEIYDMYKFTAAHRTLPFNTVVRVTNLANDKQVDLRVIDRGPFVDDRIIDLSLAGARAIDMVGPGTARVKVEIISAPGNENVTVGRFAVQVGAFADRANAERLREKLAADYQSISILDTTGPSGRLFRVRVGSEPSEASAQKLGNKLSGETGLHTFVVRLDDAPASAAAPGTDLRR